MSGEHPASSPESTPDSRLAEFAAEACRQMGTTLLEHTGDELRARLREQLTELGRALDDPASLGDAPPADPPWVNRRGIVDVNTNPVTSRRNPLAPTLTETTGDDGDVIVTVAPLGRRYQGPRDRVHGGYLGVLLDHVLWRAVLAGRGGVSFTRSLTITYDRAAPIGGELTVTGRVVGVDARATRAAGEVLAEGTVCARAEGLWVSPRPRE